MESADEAGSGESLAAKAFRALYGADVLKDPEKVLEVWHKLLQRKNAVDQKFMEHRAAVEKEKQTAVSNALKLDRERHGPFVAFFFACRREWRDWAKRYYRPRWDLLRPTPLSDHEGVIRMLRSWWGPWYLSRFLGRWFSRKDARILANMLEVDEKDFGPFNEAARGGKRVWHGLHPDYQKFFGE